MARQEVSKVSAGETCRTSAAVPPIWVTHAREGQDRT